MDAQLPTGRRLNLLDGVRVLDLTAFLAGPFTSMVLADLGAKVTKVERLTGDSSRGNPPYFHDGDSAYYLSINRNKASVALDLKSTEGRKILSGLVAESDIVVDNMRPGQRESLGVDFDHLVSINPNIVSCSVTGFGADGPYSDRPAYDIIVEAMAGVMSLTGPEGGPSVRAGVPIGDITAGLYLAIGALAALQRQRTTGEPQYVDVAMLDSQISLLSYLAQYYLTGGLVATHQGRAHVSIPTYNTFPTFDGEIVVAANTQGMWESLARELGLDELCDDSRFLTKADRLKHRNELIPLIHGRTLERTTEDLHHALVTAGVPVAPINNIEQALHDPQVRHREMLVKVDHHRGTPFATLGSPIKSPGSKGETFTSPPDLGGHSEAVLARLGYTNDQIEELHAAGVVRLAGRSGGVGERNK